MKRDKLNLLRATLKQTYSDALSFKEGGININEKSLAGKRGTDLPPAYRTKESYGYFEGRLPKPYFKGGIAHVDKVVFPKVRELTSAVTNILDTTSNSIKYISNGTFDQNAADAATAFINKQLNINNWADILQSVIPEALIGGVSFIKRHYEDVVEERVNNYVGYTQQQFDSLKLASPNSEFQVNKEYEVEEEVPVMGINPQTGEQEVTEVKVVKIKKLDITETYTENSQGLKICYVPQNEVYMLSHDNKIPEASYFCQRKLLYRYQLREWFTGAKASKIIDNAIPDSYLESLDSDNDYNALQKIEGNVSSTSKERDKIYLFEQYIRFDGKLYQVFTIGLEDNILEMTEVDEIPYEAIVPLKIADSLWSLSVADTLKQEQDTQTAILRGMLDNINQANYGRYMMVKNQVDKKALLDNRPGGVVEQNAPGMVDRFPYHSIPGGSDFLYQEVSKRADDIAGSSASASGIAEKLFNNGGATGAAIAASIKELREKDIAASIVTTGIKPLYEALFRLARENIREELSVNIGGKEIPVQPSAWPQEVDVKVDIVTKQDRAVKSQNELVFFQKLNDFRQDSPIPQEWVAKASALAESLGIEYVMSDIAMPGDIPPPQPSPEQQVALARAQIEIQKIQADMEEVRAQRDIKMREFDQSERKAALEAINKGRELALREKELGVKYKGIKLENELDRDKFEVDSILTTKFSVAAGKVQNVGLGDY